MATTEAPRSVKSQPKTLLIDTDVHEVMRTNQVLFPYLDPHWQRYLGDYSGTMIGTQVPASFPYATPTPGPGRLEWVPPDRIAGADLDLMKEHLFEGQGVSVAILCGFFHASALRANYELAAAMASAYNDWQIEHWLEKEPRLRGSVHVVADDPAVAAREIDRVGGHPQIVQVFLPSVTDRQYGDPRYRPIWEAALRNQLVVSFHHGQHTQTVLGYPRYYIEWKTTAPPQAAQNQILSLIANGTFDKYPELKVVFLETGVAWVPWFMWRLDQQYRECRVEVPWIKRLPSDHMRDNVRLSTQPLADITPRQFQQLIEMVESERMFLFSTDYPHYDADDPDKALPSTLPEDLRNRVRYQNALETYPKLAGLGS
jgi:uncharacterized protein